MNRYFPIFLVGVLLLVGWAGEGMAQGTTAFTYQGRLTDGATPANGPFDLHFTLFDAASGGTQQGSMLLRPGVTVTNGVFSVQLDFGAVPFAATGARFLEISVRPGGSAGAFTVLTPRQQVTPTPYAIKSQTADLATLAMNATQLGGLSAANFVQATDPRLSDPRPPQPGSSNYIQNGTTPQATSNFNISGTGTATEFTSRTQYNIDGLRVLSVPGLQNVFTGIGAGAGNTTGISNAFFGHQSGMFNQTGNGNSFFGFAAGRDGTSASFNAFFGASSGLHNESGFQNSFFGTVSGQNNRTGHNNAFFGFLSGFNNDSGFQNTFFGTRSGQGNITGGNNTFIGFNAGGTSPGNLNFAAAIGAEAQVSQSNTIILGRTGGLDNVGINTTTPTDRLQVNGNVRATAFIQSSDARYKTDIRTIEDALEALLKLRGVTFQWREDMNVDGTPGRQVGFIAQEVEEVLPEVVTTAKDGYKAVSYTNVVPLLVEAIKDQQKEIEALKSIETENVALKARLAAIEERLGKIERASSTDKK